MNSLKESISLNINYEFEEEVLFKRSMFIEGFCVNREFILNISTEVEKLCLSKEYFF